MSPEIDEEELREALYEGLLDATPEEMAYYFSRADKGMRITYVGVLRTKPEGFRRQFRKCLRSLVRDE